MSKHFWLPTCWVFPGKSSDKPEMVSCNSQTKPAHMTHSSLSRCDSFSQQNIKLSDCLRLMLSCQTCAH